MKTVYDALKLLNDGHPHKRHGFSMCYGWFFEYEGRNYWLSEMKGQYLKLETMDLPRELIHEISLNGE